MIQTDNIVLFFTIKTLKTVYFLIRLKLKRDACNNERPAIKP